MTHNSPSYASASACSVHNINLMLDHAHAIIRATETIVSIDETVSSIDAAIAFEISQPQGH